MKLIFLLPLILLTNCQIGFLFCVVSNIKPSPHVKELYYAAMFKTTEEVIKIMASYKEEFYYLSNICINDHMVNLYRLKSTLSLSNPLI